MLPLPLPVPLSLPLPLLMVLLTRLTWHGPAALRHYRQQQRKGQHKKRTT